ncbi:MAG: hypothetical protein GY845_03220 [Planctomycetes bacterium]|nr:hypothetical protein [Planctomycetota bacterium]
MTQSDIKRLGLILAIQAEIEGMKAHNTYCMYTAKYIAYDESAFIDKAEELRNMSYCHDQQL